MELAAAIKLRERCIAAQRELLMGLTEEQRQGISPFYRAAIMGEAIEDTIKKAQPPEDDEIMQTYQEIVVEEPKQEIDETKIEYDDNVFYEVAEGNTGEDEENSLIEEADYESSSPTTTINRWRWTTRPPS